MKKIFIPLLLGICAVIPGFTPVFGQYPGSGQTLLSASKIPQFVDPLPHFAGRRVNVKTGGNLIMRVVPSTQVAVSTGTVLNSNLDTVGKQPGAGMAHFWTYSISKDSGATWTTPHWPAYTIEAGRNYPLNIKYRNDLYGQTYANVNIAVDQSIMWAAPAVTGDPMMDPYTGPVPVVVHLHGAEVQSTSDGATNAWFTPGYTLTGPGFAKGCDSVYHYPNSQEATTLWYHDHTMGATRLNVYSGMAGFYFLRGSDEENDHLPGWSGDDLVKEVKPSGKSGVSDTIPYLPEIELAVQDRMFDTHGQLYWPTDPTDSSTHPFWNMQFFGNVMTVNGKTYPYLSVAPRKYRFHVLDGCNARFLNMWLMNLATSTNGPSIKLIGTDGGMLDVPVTLNPSSGDKLFLAPGERADIVIDFSGVTAGTVLTLVNDASAPYMSMGGGGGGGMGGGGMGGSSIDAYTGRILQFVVNGQMISAANHLNAGSDKSLVPSSLRQNAIVKLTNFSGSLNVTPLVKRQLTLNTGPMGGMGGMMSSILLLNNSRFDTNSAMMGNDTSGMKQFGELTEKPKTGTVELWQIANLTMMTHPIHMHLVQFQLVSRQKMKGMYNMTYQGAFSGVNGGASGMYIGGEGPPYLYDVPNSDGAVGGNPSFSPYLMGSKTYPTSQEKGWKDTYKVFPMEVATFIVRFAPTDKPLTTPADSLKFKFDPSVGPGYVWHCHIIDHEDNEMMRPFVMQSATAATGPKKLRLKLFLEGLYGGNGMMNCVMDSTCPHWDSLTADHITVELHNKTSYANTVFTLNQVCLKKDGSALAIIPDSLNDRYYITIRHRNSITTVSAAPVSFADTVINYDFSSAASKAFGNNMKKSGNYYVIYTGDLSSVIDSYPDPPDQDGVVDMDDNYYIFNAYLNGQAGFVHADLNGDGVVDIDDLYMAYANLLLGVYNMTP